MLRSSSDPLARHDDLSDGERMIGDDVDDAEESSEQQLSCSSSTEDER